jgi:hydrogenase nickel incorporation protein HypB
MTIKVIKVGEDILGANEEKARANKQQLDKRNVFTINIMSSPGAGKTSVILSTINRLKDRIKMAVIEGDVASSVDAEKVSNLGIPVVQINTAGGCHLDANMVETAINSLPLDETDLLFIENVGNLICPNAFLLGEDRRIMISSLPEGDDKPYKYPAMFADTDIILLNKTDLQPYLDFNFDNFEKSVINLNSDATIFPVSCKTGDGMEDWFTWLEAEAKRKKDQAA